MKKLAILICLLVISLASCERGDFRASPIIEGQTTVHAGYNVGPELYLEAGDKAKVTGAVIWIKGFDPNDLFE